jgi:hypothetical protein
MKNAMYLENNNQYTWGFLCNYMEKAGIRFLNNEYYKKRTFYLFLKENVE